MTFFKKIRRFFSTFLKKEEYPVHAVCALCKKQVYLPYHCSYCDRFYCADHRLPFNHDCRNINAWKNRETISGPVREYRSDRVRVKK